MTLVRFAIAGDIAEQRLADEKILIRQANRDDLMSVLEMLSQHFEHWIPEVKIALNNTPNCLHLYDHKKIKIFISRETELKKHKIKR